MMKLARSNMLSLMDVPDDIKLWPEAVLFTADGNKNISSISFQTHRYTFIWNNVHLKDSEMSFVPKFGTAEHFRLYCGIPFSRRYSDIENYLTEEERTRAAVIVSFIKDEIKRSVLGTDPFLFHGFDNALGS